MQIICCKLRIYLFIFFWPDTVSTAGLSCKHGNKWIMVRLTAQTRPYVPHQTLNNVKGSSHSTAEVTLS